MTFVIVQHSILFLFQLFIVMYYERYCHLRFSWKNDSIILRSAKSNCKKNQQRIVINLHKGVSCLDICRFQFCWMWDYYKVNQIKSFWCPGGKVYLWEIVNLASQSTSDKIFGGYMKYYAMPVISKQTSNPHFIFHFLSFLSFQCR